MKYTGKTKQRVILISAVLSLFVILSLVQLPRGPYFDCYPGNRGGYRLQYGFPLVFAQRSVPTTACTWPGADKATDKQVRGYSTHHILPFAFIGDVLLWGLLGLSVIKLVERRDS